jgi:DNA helicase HerA-like ATPase
MNRHLSYFGSREGWGGEQQLVGLTQADRRSHVRVIGKTNVGKSTLLRNLIAQDIISGRGVCFIDPHGDEAQRLLDMIPPERLDQVIYFDPAGEREHPVGWNPLIHVPPDERHLVAERVLAVFRAIWKLSPERTPRLPGVLYNCLRALLDLPPRAGATLLGVPRLLSDKEYRVRVVSEIEDHQCRSFWTQEVAQKSKNDLSEMFDPVYSRVNAFLRSEVLRNVLGQPKRRVDPRQVMDRQQILIVNLRKGRLGPEAANLMGSLIVSDFESAAFSREELPEEERTSFHLVADEFQNFTTDSFATVLSEARKYGLCLTLAHQFQAQLSDEVKSAIIGNVGSTIAFRVGEEDVPLLEQQFAPIPAATLLELSRFEACAKVLREGEVDQPMLIKALPPLPVSFGHGTTALARSRRHFSRPRVEVEGRIERWLNKKA